LIYSVLYYCITFAFVICLIKRYHRDGPESRFVHSEGLFILLRSVWCISVLNIQVHNVQDQGQDQDFTSVAFVG